MLRIALVATLLLITWTISTANVGGIPYSAGSYGTCQYDTCGITLTTSSSVAINITPTPGSTTCTVNNDVVTVTTGSSTGYSVTLTDTDISNLLSGPTSISASTGTPAAPVALTANSWGYRVDNVAGFGVGPTTALTNTTIPSQAFAAVPLSSGTPALIRTTSVADSSAVNTSVWYGVCADTNIQSGTYTDSVTYTAVIN